MPGMPGRGGVLLLGWGWLFLLACSPPAPETLADSTRFAAVRMADTPKTPAPPGAAAGITTPADGSDADSVTVRLAPTAFTELPAGIVRALLARGCTIPQPWYARRPANVIRGEFARRGRTDWAVLCSRNRESALLVFWSGAADSIAEHAPVPDRYYLQGVGNGRIGFSRVIGVAGRDFIMEHHREYGGPEPPPIDHDGIEDAFAEKGSVVLYFYDGRWLTLTGAD